jgi:uncharacterized protein with GYD domain
MLRQGAWGNGEDDMATYIALLNWTEQGIKTVKNSPKRLDGVRKQARKLGCEMKDVYLTIGAHDLVTVIEGPDDETVARLLLSVGSAGNVRTTTLKAFPEESYRKILASI